MCRDLGVESRSPTHPSLLRWAVSDRGDAGSHVGDLENHGGRKEERTGVRDREVEVTYPRRSKRDLK